MSRRLSSSARLLPACWRWCCSRVLPAAAHAAGASEAAGPAPRAGLTAERARLRAELDKVNAEIDALKRAGGVARRLPPARAARRRRVAGAPLMEIDARLGVRVQRPAPPPRPRPPPTAAPTDGPADLDAKADILADQSRRLRAQADAFGGRAKEIKGRQELRRRAADLDRDPFAAMEGSKRRVAQRAPARARPRARPRGPAASTPAEPPRAIAGPRRRRRRHQHRRERHGVRSSVPAPVSTAIAPHPRTRGRTAPSPSRCSSAICSTPRRWPTSAGSSRGHRAAPRRRSSARPPPCARAPLELDARARTMRAQAHQPQR